MTMCDSQVITLGEECLARVLIQTLGANSFGSKARVSEVVQSVSYSLYDADSIHL